MDILTKAAAAVIIMVIIIIFLKIFTTPLRFIFKLLINTFLGFLALILINFLGSRIGISLGVNWVNAIVVGVLGLPGAALLLILTWLSVI